MTRVGLLVAVLLAPAVAAAELVRVGHSTFLHRHDAGGISVGSRHGPTVRVTPHIASYSKTTF